MKRMMTALGAACLGSVTLVPAPAVAQPSDLDPAAVSAATRYALPVLFDSFMTECFDSLEGDGYAITNADTLRDRFNENREASWPGAKALFIQFAQEEVGEGATVLELLGDDEFRTLVDSLLASVVTEEIRDNGCSDIERGLEILDPLPADNLAAFVGFLVDLGLRGENENADVGGPYPIQQRESRERKLREQEEERQRRGQ